MEVPNISEFDFAKEAVTNVSHDTVVTVAFVAIVIVGSYIAWRIFLSMIRAISNSVQGK